MSIKATCAWVMALFLQLSPPPAFSPLLTPAGVASFAPNWNLPKMDFEKAAEIPLSAGSSCRKQQNRELNLESDERTWTGTPDISQICSPAGLIVLLPALTSRKGSMRASLHLLHWRKRPSMAASMDDHILYLPFSSTFLSEICLLLNRSSMGVIDILQTVFYLTTRPSRRHSPIWHFTPIQVSL